MGISVKKKPVAGVAAPTNPLPPKTPPTQIYADEPEASLTDDTPAWEAHVNSKNAPDAAEAPAASVAPTSASVAKVKKNVEMKAAVAVVSKTHSDGSVQEEKIPVGEPEQFSGPTANVGFSFGMTKNLGNFNNLKYQVSLHIPCLATAEEIEQAYEEAKNWVDSKVAAIEEEISEQLGQ